MKRDWNLLRDQLMAIEQDEDLRTTILSAIPPAPDFNTTKLSEEDFNNELKAHELHEERILGHLEMLVENGYIDGIKIERGFGGFSCSIWKPRLTMAGHDLLDTMRSQTVWEKVQSTARDKGLELTFDTIKALAVAAVKSIAG